MRKRDHYVVLAVALLAGLAGGFIAGSFFAPESVNAQDKSRRLKVLEAEGVHLVDQSGRTRATFEIGADGSVGLAMADQDGISRTKLGVGVDGKAVLELKDEKAQTRAKLVVSHTGRPTLLLLDRIGRGDAVLGEVIIPISDVGIVEERPAGSLILTNKDGKVVWRMP